MITLTSLPALSLQHTEVPGGRTLEEEEEECDILGKSKHTLTPPTYFQGVKTPNPQDLHPWRAPTFSTFMDIA